MSAKDAVNGSSKDAPAKGFGAGPTGLGASYPLTLCTAATSVLKPLKGIVGELI